MTVKPIYKSKTYWFGLLVFAVSLLQYVQGSEFIQQHPRITAGIGSVVGVLIVVLRFVTKTGILSDPPAEVKK